MTTWQRQQYGKPRWQRGFSLLELLVAMAVTVVIALMAYQFIDSAVAVSGRSEQMLSEVETLERFWQVLEADLQHSVAVPKPAAHSGQQGVVTAFEFSGGGALLTASAQVALEPDTGTPLLRLTRDGWANPLQQARSNLQRVVYTWRDGEVLRLAWPERNQAPGQEPATRQLLLEGAQAIHLRFFPATGQQPQRGWVDDWPPPALAGAPPQDETDLPPPLPLAVAVAVDMAGLGEVERLFTLSGL